MFFSDDVQKEINEIDKQLLEIEKEYLEDYLKHPFRYGACTLEMEYRNDSRVKVLEKLKIHIYEQAVPKMIVTAENEEEKKKLKEFCKELNEKQKL